MKTNFAPLISKPCPANWGEMSGDDKRRFCQHCQLHVHNLTAMSEKERVDLLGKATGRTCVAYVATDSTITVRTGFWLWLQRLKLAWRAGLALVVAALPVSLVSCAGPKTPAPPASITPADQPVKMGKVAAPTKNPVTESCDAKQMPLGVIGVDEPLWKRLLFFWR